MLSHKRTGKVINNDAISFQVCTLMWTALTLSKFVFVLCLVRFSLVRSVRTHQHIRTQYDTRINTLSAPRAWEQMKKDMQLTILKKGDYRRLSFIALYLRLTLPRLLVFNEKVCWEQTNHVPCSQVRASSLFIFCLSVSVTYNIKNGLTGSRNKGVIQKTDIRLLFPDESKPSQNICIVCFIFFIEMTNVYGKCHNRLGGDENFDLVIKGASHSLVKTIFSKLFPLHFVNSLIKIISGLCVFL